MLLVSGIALESFAEIYIYRGPNGERMITDKPPHPSEDYSLVSKRDTISDAGHILANRPIQMGGPEYFRYYINQASDKFDVDPALVEAVIQVESGFDPNAVSKKGATGLMQLMQKTAKQYEVTNRFNPKQNINAGVEHLSTLLERYDGQVPLALAAYNAGSTAVEKYNGVPPFPETKRYISKVLKAHGEFRQFRYGVSGGLR